MKKSLLLILLSLSLNADFIPKVDYQCTIDKMEIPFKIVDKGSVLIYAYSIGFNIDPGKYALVFPSGLRSVITLNTNDTITIHGENLPAIECQCALIKGLK